MHRKPRTILLVVFFSLSILLYLTVRQRLQYSSFLEGDLVHFYPFVLEFANNNNFFEAILKFISTQNGELSVPLLNFAIYFSYLLFGPSTLPLAYFQFFLHIFMALLVGRYFYQILTVKESWSWIAGILYLVCYPHIHMYLSALALHHQMVILSFFIIHLSWFNYLKSGRWLTLIILFAICASFSKPSILLVAFSLVPLQASHGKRGDSQFPPLSFFITCFALTFYQFYSIAYKGSGISFMPFLRVIGLNTIQNSFSPLLVLLFLCLVFLSVLFSLYRFCLLEKKSRYFKIGLSSLSLLVLLQFSGYPLFKNLFYHFVFPTHSATYSVVDTSHVLNFVPEGTPLEILIAFFSISTFLFFPLLSLKRDSKLFPLFIFTIGALLFLSHQAEVQQFPPSKYLAYLVPFTLFGLIFTLQFLIERFPRTYYITFILIFCWIPLSIVGIKMRLIKHNFIDYYWTYQFNQFAYYKKHQRIAIDNNRLCDKGLFPLSFYNHWKKTLKYEGIGPYSAGKIVLASYLGLEDTPNISASNCTDDHKEPTRTQHNFVSQLFFQGLPERFNNCLYPKNNIRSLLNSQLVNLSDANTTSQISEIYQLVMQEYQHSGLIHHDFGGKPCKGITKLSFLAKLLFL